jgi:hypothetical protein
LKKADAFDHFRKRTRRGFLGIGALGLLGSFGGFWLGASTGSSSASPEPKRPSHPQIEVAHRLALGPDEDLRSNSAMFLVIFDGIRGDPLTWAGFGRLAQMATAPGREDRRLVARLLTSARRVPPPDWLQSVIGRLEEAGR